MQNLTEKRKRFFGLCSELQHITGIAPAAEVCPPSMSFNLLKFADNIEAKNRGEKREDFKEMSLKDFCLKYYGQRAVKIIEELNEF